MRRFPLIVIGAVVIAAWASFVHPGVAHAELSDACTATATISGAGGGSYEAIDPKAKTGVYTVPIAGSAEYAASIAVTPPAEGRPISGSVGVALPGTMLTLRSWSDEDATSTSDSGTVSWELPDATPRGIPITVSGSHTDLQNCTGSVTVKLEGGLTDSVTGIASIVLTTISGLGLLVAALGKL